MMSKLLWDTLVLNQLFCDALHYPKFLARYDIVEDKWVSIPTGKCLGSGYTVLYLAILALVHLSAIWLLVGKALFALKPVSPAPVFAQLILYSILCLHTAWSYFLFHTHSHFIQHFNTLNEHVRRSVPPHPKPTTKPTIRAIVAKTAQECVKIVGSGKGDYVGVVMVSSIVVLSLFPFPMYVLTFMNQGDLVSSMLRDIIPLSEQPQPWSFILRLATSTIGFIETLEICRLLSIVLNYCVLRIRLTIHAINHLLLLNATQAAKPVSHYRRLYAIHNGFSEATANFTFMSLQMDVLALTLTLSGAIVGHRFLPAGVYLICWVFASGGVLILSTMLSQAAIPHLITSSLIDGWRKSPPSVSCEQSAKEYVRVMRTLRPIAFPVAALGFIDKSYVLKYVEKVANYTHDAVILITQICKF